jgi:uncharacterized protein YjiK
VRVAAIRHRSLCLAMTLLAMPDGRPAAAPRPTDSILARYDFDTPADRWALPRELNEVSGLALSGRRLLAHGDEQAIVYQLDPAAHRVVGQFSLGRPPAVGDFEGLAVDGGRVFLTTSDGDVYVAPVGAGGSAVAYRRYASGLGRRCEVEGLAIDAGGRGLLLGCKAARVHALRHRLAVFAWVPGGRAAPALRLAVADHDLEGLRGETVNPSELLRDGPTGHLLLLAARARAIIELSPNGEVIAVARLKRSLHRQAEGLALDQDGALYVADEAAGAQATLTTYRPVR